MEADENMYVYPTNSEYVFADLIACWKWKDCHRDCLASSVALAALSVLLFSKKKMFSQVVP